jgi:hypothetical protein
MLRINFLTVHVVFYIAPKKSLWVYQENEAALAITQGKSRSITDNVNMIEKVHRPLEK